MRRQDELLLLYPGQGRLARKYLLSQMEALALAFDSDELLEFLQGELGSEDPVLRSQALFSLTRFLPGYVRKRYELADHLRSDWSEALGYKTTSLSTLAEETKEKSRVATAVGQAARMVTRPVVDSTVEALKGLAGWSRTRAVMALGHYRMQANLAWLTAAAGQPQPDLGVGLSLAQLDRAEASRTLVKLVREKGPKNAELYLLLSGCDEQPAFDAVMDAIDRTDAVGRMNLSCVLARLGECDVVAAFHRLRQHGEGWVDTMALASLETLGRPDFLPVAREVFEKAPHRFMKIQALKLAGGISVTGSIQFCIDALKDADHGICAMAIESLVRLRTPLFEMREACLPFLTSQHVKAKVNSILVALPPEDAPDHPALRSLILSTSSVQRMEAAYCLGYLQSRKALQLLEAFTTVEPEPAVRDQAIKALSRYPAKVALRQLVPLLAAEDQRAVLTTARVITRYDGDESKHVCLAILEVLKRTKRPFVRAMLYRALGAASARPMPESIIAALNTGLDEADPTVVAGVLEGLVVAGTAGDAHLERKLRTLAESNNHRFKARALTCQFFEGDLEAPARLSRMLGSGDEKQVETALDCTLEIGMMLPAVAQGSRFPALQQALRTLSDSEECAESSRSELLQPVIIDPPPVARRAVDFQDRRGNGGLGAGDSGASPTVDASSPPANMSGGVAALRRDRDLTNKALPPAATPGSLGVAGVKDFLRGVGGTSRSSNLRGEVTAITYLVGKGLAKEAGGIGPWLARPARRVVLAIALLVFVLTIAVLRSTRDAEGPYPVPPGAPAHLWVDFLKGQGTCNDQPLKLQSPVHPGDTLVTASGSTMLLVGPRGNRVIIRPGSSTTFDGAFTSKRKGTFYRFHEARGNVLFEFKQGTALELILGPNRVMARSAWLQINREGASRSVMVVSGDAVVQTAGDELHLVKGQSTVVD